MRQPMRYAGLPKTHGVSYSDHSEEKGVFDRLMDRLCRIAPRAEGYAPVMLTALR
jgi:hypothetical protein